MIYNAPEVKVLAKLAAVTTASAEEAPDLVMIPPCVQ